MFYRYFVMIIKLVELTIFDKLTERTSSSKTEDMTGESGEEGANRNEG